MTHSHTNLSPRPILATVRLANCQVSELNILLIVVVNLLMRVPHLWYTQQYKSLREIANAHRFLKGTVQVSAIAELR